MKKIIFIIFLFLICGKLYPQNELVKFAESYLFVREITQNRSAEIDSFNRAVGAKLGSPYCASFNSWIFNHNLYENPNSAWSPDWSLKKDQIWKAKRNNNKKIEPGDVVTFYYSNLRRVGHTGIIYQIIENDDYIITIEANTGGGGINREGDGVYKKKRSLDKIYAITRYYKKSENK
jgi:hypothetical protein